MSENNIILLYQNKENNNSCYILTILINRSGELVDELYENIVTQWKKSNQRYLKLYIIKVSNPMYTDALYNSKNLQKRQHVQELKKLFKEDLAFARFIDNFQSKNYHKSSTHYIYDKNNNLWWEDLKTPLLIILDKHYQLNQPSFIVLTHTNE